MLSRSASNKSITTERLHDVFFLNFSCQFVQNVIMFLIIIESRTLDTSMFFSRIRVLG